MKGAGPEWCQLKKKAAGFAKDLKEICMIARGKHDKNVVHSFLSCRRTGAESCLSCYLFVIGAELCDVRFK
jgi:hypothetical protein